jgi:plasmid stability protein
MASITLENIPEELHACLEREAAANYRSLSQEAMARLEDSLGVDARLSGPMVDRLIQEALDSGPEETLTHEKFDEARRQGRLARRCARGG